MAWNFQRIKQYYLSRSVDFNLRPVELARVFQRLEKIESGRWKDQQSKPRAAVGDEVEIVDMSEGELLSFQLVLPAQSNPVKARFSILSPLGAAVLGLKAGETAEVLILGRRYTFFISRVIREKSEKGGGLP